MAASKRMDAGKNNPMRILLRINRNPLNGRVPTKRPCPQRAEYDPTGATRASVCLASLAAHGTSVDAASLGRNCVPRRPWLR